MPYLGGCQRIAVARERVQRCFNCASLDPDREEFRRRMQVVTAEPKEDVIYRFYFPRRINAYLTFEHTLGEGGYGTVFKAKLTEEGAKKMPLLSKDRAYAVKRISVRTSELVSKSLVKVSVDRVVEFMQALRSKETEENYVVRFHAFIVQLPVCSFQVMDLTEGPDLFDFIAGRTSTVPERQAAKIMTMIFTALHYLHRTVGVLHRDIKPDNWGFEKPIKPGCRALPDLKLFDFGLAWLLEKPVTEESAKDCLQLRCCGTPMYMAPETWNKRSGPPSDIWSGALIMHLLLTCDLPFNLLGTRDFFDAVHCLPLDMCPAQWSHVSPEAQELIRRTLRKDPKARATTTEILDDPWFEAPGCERVVTRCRTSPGLVRSRVFGSDTVWSAVAGTSCVV